MKKYLTDTTKITAKYQTVIPKVIRQAMNLKINGEIIWHVIKTGEQPVILATPKPKNWAQYLSGLGKNIWQDIDTDLYLANLKQEWKK